MGQSYDFSMLYASSAALADGRDPYVLADATQSMAQRGGQLDATAVLLYPHTALAVLWPLTWLSWNAARLTWVGVQLLAFVGLAAGLRRLSGGRLNHGPASCLWVVAWLLWAPVHTGFAVGQAALPVVFGMVWALVLAEDGKRWGAAILLGAAMALKPQLGLAFLPLFVMRKHWVAGLGAVLVLALFSMAGARLDGTAPDWGKHWLANLQAFSHGGYGDVALPWARAQMVQASALFASLGVASPEAWGCGLAGLPACVWLAAQWRSRGTRPDPLDMAAMLSLLALLAGYHRSYDAVLALVPMSWALRRLADHWRDGPGLAVALALAAFVTPGGAWLFQACAAHAGAWWMQYQTLALVAATAGMLAAMLIREKN